MPKAARSTRGPNATSPTSTSTSTPYPPASTRKSHPPRPSLPASSSSPCPPFLSTPLLPASLDPDAETQTVPIYDSCDEIRSKITAFLASQHPVPGFDKPYTKKMFLAQIGGLNANSLRRFMDAAGEGRGSENGVYFGAYCFFEKLRIFKDEPKSATRVANELSVAQNSHPSGLPRHDPARSHAGEPMQPPPSPTSSPSSAPAWNNGGRKWKRQPPSIIVGPGENPSDFLTEEEKSLWYFPCEAVGHKHGHGLGRGRRGGGKGVARKK